MINAYYVIRDRKYLDRYLIRENLQVTKSGLQHILKHYEIPGSEIITLQNKKLYSIESIYALVENIVYDHENG